MLNLSKHRTRFFFLILIFVLAGTFLAVKYTQGYRIDFVKQTIKSTGLLVATSNPNGASVIINGKLNTATNNTVSLEPGLYQIQIKKEGFNDWKKDLLIQKELVTQTLSFLFPKVPDLKPITYSEILNPLLSPDRTTITYIVPLPNTEAGVWILELNDSPLGFSKQPRLIAKSESYWDFSKATLFWSPDSRELLVDFSPSGKYLLSPDQLNTVENLKNIAGQIDLTYQRWQIISEAKNEAERKELPPKLEAILATNSAQLTFSPDNSKVLYVATASASLPENLIPSVPAASTQKETRLIKPNTLYVYDIKEDKNFEISNFPASTARQDSLARLAKRGEQLPIIKTPTPKRVQKTIKTSPSLSQFQISSRNLRDQIPLWFPTSRHLFWIADGKIIACEYDNTNLTTIYSGPLISPYIFATQGTNRLIILAETDLQASRKPNLYEVVLR